MKPHRILKSFKGSQTGHDHHHFAEGTEADLSDDLAAVVVKAGWAEPIEDPVEPEELDEETVVEEKSLDSAPENKMRKPVKGKK